MKVFGFLLAMTLQASGPISINDIAAEFGIANNSEFPTAFYGLGGAPASGALSLSDFYGRSNTLPVDFTIGARTGAGTTYRRTLTSSVSGGSGSYTYSWSLSGQSGSRPLQISGSSTGASVVVQVVGTDGDTASALVTLDAHDTSGATGERSKTVVVTIPTTSCPTC